MMKKYAFFFVIIEFITLSTFGNPIVLSSPDNRVQVNIELKDKIYYSVQCIKDIIMDNCYLALSLPENNLGDNPKLLKKEIYTINEKITPVVAFKNSVVANNCNVLKLTFKDHYAVEFRAYNDGFAYRFITDMKGDIIVKDEDTHIHFPDNYTSVFSETRSFQCDYQILYKAVKVNDITNKMSTLPVLFDANGKYKILVSETDLFDYPCLFLKGEEGNAVRSVFPKCPLEFGFNGDRNEKIVKEADYIAKTKGSRTFPWRYFLITESDKQIVENEMSLRLSRPNQIADCSWIKPGQVTWEWWHGARIYGVDFKSGFNQDSYKYYIDFASKHGIPYILMDEGWAKSTMDPFTPNPTIDLFKLIEYGKSKNVKIVLWLTWLAVEKNFSLFKTFQDWGIAGVKIDFMDRSDQWMVDYYERVAKEAAKYHILVDFHGAFKPAGLERSYPNVLSYEGVVGMEGNIMGGVATTDNNVYLPFLRNAVGPMDFTPGAMFSAHREDFRGTWTNTMSIGTRAHQLALYVIFESGFQMLADNPYNYNRETECVDFITSVPVTWDETKVLDAKVGEYLVVARRKGDKWFIGAFTNSKERNLEIKTDFLKTGHYSMSLIQDGINADVQAMDYKKIIKQVKNNDIITISMVKEGGWVATLEPVK